MPLTLDRKQSHVRNSDSRVSWTLQELIFSLDQPFNELRRLASLQFYYKSFKCLLEAMYLGTCGPSP
jgi:hypothetical protein